MAAPNWDLLLCNVVYPCSADFREWARGDVAIVGSFITDVGPELPRNAVQCLDYAGLVLIPGLYNFHTHGHGLLRRLNRENRRIDDWPPSCLLRVDDDVALESCLRSAKSVYAESLLSGAVFLADHLRSGLPAAPFNQARQALGMLGWAHVSSPSAGQGPISLPHETHPSFRLSLDEASRQPRRPTVIHAQETPRRVDYVLSLTGHSTVELLAQYALLDSNMFLVHLGEYSKNDLDLIALHGAHVVATPTAEMRLGERTIDIEDARAHGVSLLIGTDGPAYHEKDDLFSDIRLLCLLWAQAHGPEAVREEEVLEMVTWKSASAAGRRGGRLETGQVADLVALEFLYPTPAITDASPLGRLASQVVYGASKSVVRTVIVNGRILVESAKLRQVSANYLSSGLLQG